tara:strand:- start:56867 stop:57742 length:876 start_codon:yes stop_codon:yes gene_type:complete
MSKYTNAPTNPLWSESKIKNYLPHMTSPEVKALIDKSDLVIIPIAALEQHSKHLPIGTDFINGIEWCKLIAQERDILVAPVLMAGQSPYHMEFAGTITLSAETIAKVHLEAVESLMKHGFKRFIVMNSHGGNRAITTYLVDQINQTTSGVAVDFGLAVQPFMAKSDEAKSEQLDRHAGTEETSDSLYLMPSLVQMDQAETGKLNLPTHLEKMVPEVIKGNETTTMLFLAEGLKAKSTGKKTSSIEMTSNGIWGDRNIQESSAHRGKKNAMRLVNAAVQFIDKWNSLVASKK